MILKAEELGIPNSVLAMLKNDQAQIDEVRASFDQSEKQCEDEDQAPIRS
jgi:hypothetical protein